MEENQGFALIGKDGTRFTDNTTAWRPVGTPRTPEEVARRMREHMQELLGTTVVDVTTEAAINKEVL